MNRASLKPRLLFIGVVVVLALIFVWVTQNPMWYFEKVLTVCGTVMGLYLVAAIGIQIYLWSQPNSKAKNKKLTPASQPVPDFILTNDGEIIEIVDGEKPKRDPDEAV